MGIGCGKSKGTIFKKGKITCMVTKKEIDSL
jgi:hypothetical protein